MSEQLEHVCVCGRSYYSAEWLQHHMASCATAGADPRSEASGPEWKCKTHGQYFPACIPCATENANARSEGLKLAAEGLVKKLTKERDDALLQVGELETQLRIEKCLHVDEIERHEATLRLIGEIKRRLEDTLEMNIGQCCKRLLAATLDGIDNLSSPEKRKDDKSGGDAARCGRCGRFYVDHADDDCQR